MPLAPGTRLGTYRIVSLLGAGGMGEVYRARDTKLERDVAVKVLPPRLAEDAESLARFEREARSVAALSHPSIVAIFDSGRVDGTAYAVAELLEGETLRDKLEAGAIPQRKAVDWARDVALGLAAAHAKGIVHRDIKPENLFVTREGQIKILDFGLAKTRQAPSDEDVTALPTATPQTEPGIVMGTVGYMSPEQVRGQVVDHRTDIFSFGAVLYEMLSGRRAFKRDTAGDTMSAILRDEPPELSGSGRAIPPELERVVLHCLEKSPDERFQSARDIAFALQPGTSAPHAAMPGPVTAAAADRPRRARWPLLLAAVAAALALGVVAGRGSVRIPSPVFKRLTFRHGALTAARFADDGQMAVYSAAWEGSAMQLYSARPDSPDSPPLPLSTASLLALSPKGEMAIQLAPSKLSTFRRAGMLARVPLSGGAPRELTENVEWADWAPDGEKLAVVREEGGKRRLEMPPGKVLFETGGWISHPRVSPKGDLVAFIEHPVINDDGGSIAVVDAAGKARTLSAGWASAQGLAWSPRGEVWFTAARVGSNRDLHAVTTSGKQRTVMPTLRTLTLHDVAPGGRVLVSDDNVRGILRGLLPPEPAERDLSFLDLSRAADLSRDGKTLLFFELGDGGGASYSVYLRREAGLPVRLGAGAAVALSPDGRWVATHVGDPSRLVLLPTGAGEAKTLPGEALGYTEYGSFLPDGRKIVFYAAPEGRSGRLYVQDIAGGTPHALTAEGQVLSGKLTVLPDGASVAARFADGRIHRIRLDGSGSEPIPGTEPGDFLASRLAADDRSLLLWRFGEDPCRVLRLDTATGSRQVLREVRPPNAAGVEALATLITTPDGQSYAYSFVRTLSDLVMVDGLR